MISFTPPPPIASTAAPLVLSSNCRKRFIWYTEPCSDDDAAKNILSEVSQARQDIASGNMNVVNKDREERSHSCRSCVSIRLDGIKDD